MLIFLLNSAKSIIISFFNFFAPFVGHVAFMLYRGVKQFSLFMVCCFVV